MISVAVMMKKCLKKKNHLRHKNSPFNQNQRVIYIVSDYYIITLKRNVVEENIRQEFRIKKYTKQNVVLLNK